MQDLKIGQDGDQAHSLWGGRFTEKVDPIMVHFNESIHVDKRFWSVDIEGSKAYAQAIGKAGIITPDETAALVDGLEKVAQEWKTGTFSIQPSDEDIHTANERRLGELIGTHIAGKLHTGRSRNDQVATDLRLWLRLQIKDTIELLRQFVLVGAERAEADIDVLIPGYTHLQRAQPVRWSHWVLAHCWPCVRDVQRFADLYQRTNKCPLGSGALAGNPLGIDRTALSTSLHFFGPTENSLDAVSDRDPVAEYLFCASLTLTHLSRWAEDLIIYSTAEFGFVSLSDAYSTGSSLMPQKKNPDSLELIRGRAGHVLGLLFGFMTTLKGLPSTYNKDLQGDKAPLFEAVDTLKAILLIASRVLKTLKINAQKMQGALSADMLATDLADYLVRKGLPFREAHHVVGEVVKLGETTKRPISQISVDELHKIHALFASDVSSVWDYNASVEKRNVVGGTSLSAVKQQLEQLRSWHSKPVDLEN